MSKFDLALKKYLLVRKRSEVLCDPLEIDDFNMQAMIFGSPPKWNLGHCTWAFEAFVLGETVPSYHPYDVGYAFLFNSYYETVGTRIRRDKRYLLSRPTVKEVFKYRKYVDEEITGLLSGGENRISDVDDFLFRLELAINHEQQHQELFLTDLKHIFFESPLQPVYMAAEDALSQAGQNSGPAKFTDHEGCLTEIGHDGNGFAYDNEGGRHKVYLNPFSLMNRMVTNGEFLEFVEDGGYGDFRWWLSDAWACANREEWEQPIYWTKQEGKWYEFTLHGLKELNLNAPVCHVSFYEADAYARYKGMRLPTEFEWEYVAGEKLHEIESGHFMDNEYYHPVAEKISPEVPSQFFGNVWEWTQSQYLPYPHFKALPGAAGEYNGKFMSDQRVLRGGSCGTPQDHIRASYRNFFEGFQRWQFSGFRLAQDL